MFQMFPFRLPCQLLLKILYAIDVFLSENIRSQIQAAKAARERLEVVEIRITVQPHEIGFVIGKGGKQIQGLEQLSSCRIKMSQNEVVVTGSRTCVEKARALLAYTLETLKEQVCIILSCLSPCCRLPS
jgi:predicted RNA-binding protein YlqC (UPF0109 family)